MAQPSEQFKDIEEDIASSNHELDEDVEATEIDRKTAQGTERVRTFRFLVGCLLLGTIIVVVVTYRKLVNEQNDSFEAAFSQFGGSVHDALMKQQRGLWEASNALTKFISLQSELMNVSWPFYNMPNHDDFFRDEIGPKDIEAMGVYVLTPHEYRQAMVDYEAQVCPDRLVASHLHAFGNTDLIVPGVADDIVAISDDGLVSSPEKEFYGLNTYRYPPIDSCSIQMDYLSDPEYGPLVDMAIELDQPLITTVRGYAEPSEGMSRIHAQFHSQVEGATSEVVFPHSFMFDPVHQTLDPESPVVAIVFTNIAWDLALRRLIPDDVTGLIVVGHNSCNQSFTYRIEGQDAWFEGHGDLHDQQFNDMGIVVELNSDRGPEYFNAPHHCYYTMNVYPSQAFKDQYITNSPVIFVASIVTAFVLTILAFFIFDWAVESRNKKLAKSAAESAKVVATMYPGKLREQVLNQPKAKYRFDGTAGFEGIPLAEIYPETTILFADIVGFTEWSAGREPAKVFALLEGIFGAFDEVAGKKKVFKVETVGDCYVAVTGLPYAQADHCIRMCRFAHTCLGLFATTTKQLEEQLGTGTSGLNVRIGIHCGQVTGGVLRGLRSRFQLFGDAMNTASRHETTGQPGRIHISKECAELVRKAGKAEWLEKRQDTVVAKGKGELETYWLNVKDHGTESQSIRTFESGEK